MFFDAFFNVVIAAIVFAAVVLGLVESDSGAIWNTEVLKYGQNDQKNYGNFYVILYIMNWVCENYDF